MLFMVEIYVMRGEKGSFKPYCLEFLDMKNKISEEYRFMKWDWQQWKHHGRTKSSACEDTAEKSPDAALWGEANEKDSGTGA